MTIKTNKEWNGSKLTLDEYLNPLDEIDEALFFDQLGVVPPVRQSGTGFLMGEPKDFNEQGQAIYYHYEQIGDKFFYMGLLTVKEFDQWNPQELKDHLNDLAAEKPIPDDDENTCHDCGAAVGETHDGDCDVARCPVCGRQRLSCEHSDLDVNKWTGTWPGVEDAERFGWYSKMVPGQGWVQCNKEDEGATADLNRLHEGEECYWDADEGCWKLWEVSDEQKRRCMMFADARNHILNHETNAYVNLVVGYYWGLLQNDCRNPQVSKFLIDCAEVPHLDVLDAWFQRYIEQTSKISSPPFTDDVTDFTKP